MKKIYIFILSVLWVLSAAFLLTACSSEITIAMRLTVSDDMIDSIDYVSFGGVQAYKKQSDDSLFIVDGFGHKGKTADVEIRFLDGVEPIDPALTVDGENFTDFSLETDPNNEFSKYMSFKLACEKGAEFSMSLEATGMKKIDKDLEIDLVLPQSDGKFILEDYAGTRYVDVISVLAHKDGESEPQYYTLAEIAQIDEQKPTSTFRAHVEIAKPVNTWIPIIHVRSASQYVNEYIGGEYVQNDKDTESWIVKMFRIGDNQLFLTRDAYEYGGGDIKDKILTGNLNLSLEEDKLISGAETLTIDANVMTSDNSNKTYPLQEDRSRLHEFEDVRWSFSESLHNYGREQKISLTPTVVPGSRLTKENVDVTNAQVFVNGVEIDALTKKTGGSVHSLEFTLGAQDSSSMIGGQRANDEYGTLRIDVQNIGLRGVDDHMVVWEFPTVFGDENLGELIPSSQFAAGVVGKKILGDTVRYTFVMTEDSDKAYANEFMFHYYDFGYKKFKLQLTAPEGTEYKTNEIDALKSTEDYESIFKTATGAINSFVTAKIDANYGNLYIKFGNLNDGTLTWRQLSGYKLEFVEATEFEGSIQLEIDPACTITSFKIDDVETPFTNPSVLQSIANYSIGGTAADPKFQTGQQYVFDFQCLDAEGNVLNAICGWIINMGGYSINPVETAGELSFVQDFFVRSRCRLGKTEEGKIVQIAKVVFTLGPAPY